MAIIQYLANCIRMSKLILNVNSIFDLCKKLLYAESLVLLGHS